MSKSKTLTNKRWLFLGGFISMLTLSAGFFISPFGKAFLSNRSNALTEEGDRLAAERPFEAIYSYQSALHLNPQNSKASTKIAYMYQKHGQPDQALKILNSLSQINLGDEALYIKSQAYLEQSQPDEAIKSIQQAVSQNPSEDNLLQLGLSYLASKSTNNLSPLLERLGDSKAAHELKRASSHNTAFAQVLYAHGLLRSSERVLMQSLTNSEDYLLLTRIRASRGEWDSALDSASSGIKMDPGNLKLHILLRQIYLEVGNQPAADREGRFIKALQTGRI